MAFSNTMTSKYVEQGGLVVEEGTWNGAAVTTGTITADTGTQPEMQKVEEWFFSSNGDTAVNVARDGNIRDIKITFSNGDAGTYRLKGKAA